MFADEVGLTAPMPDLVLTGAQKTRLRGIGQTLEPHLKVGKAGLTPAFFKELDLLLGRVELVKLRFIGADRNERAALIDRIAAEGACHAVGAVGHTALFFRPKPSEAAP